MFLDTDMIRQQLQAVASAPIVILPTLVALSVSTWWLTKQFTQAQLKAAESGAKMALDNAKLQIEAAQINAKERMDILLERMRLADDKELALKKQIEELKFEISKVSPNQSLKNESQKLDIAYDDFSAASTSATSAVQSAVGTVQNLFASAVKAIGSL